MATIGGVAYYDDSKATTPAAVTAAVRGFSSVVLILGGRNKGLDLSTIRRAVDDCAGLVVRGVVAIGEAAEEVVAAFSPGHAVARAESMGEAVSLRGRHGPRRRRGAALAGLRLLRLVRVVRGAWRGLRLGGARTRVA